MALLLYDAECGFCRTWVRRSRSLLRAGVRLLPLQEFSSPDPRLSRAELRREIKLVLPGGRVFSGAEALAQAVGGVALLYYLPGVSWLADRLYSRVARRRNSAANSCSVRTGHTRN